VAKKLAIDPAVANILDNGANEPIIPERKLDPRTAGFLGESLHTTVNAIARDKNADGNIGRKLAKVLVIIEDSGDDLSSQIFSWMGSWFGETGDMQVIAYCPTVHVSMPDPMAIAKKQGIWPYETSFSKKEQFIALVHSTLPTGLYGSATFTATNPDAKAALSGITVGSWVWVEYGDEVNKTHGFLLEPYNRPGSSVCSGEMADYPTWPAGHESRPRSPGADNSPAGQRRVQDASRAAARKHNLPPEIMLAIGELEARHKDGGWYYDTNGIITFRPYGIQITHFFSQRGASSPFWEHYKVWRKAGGKRGAQRRIARGQPPHPSEIAVINAVDNDLALKADYAATLLKKHYDANQQNADLVRIAYGAGDSVARKWRTRVLRDGRFPRYYLEVTGNPPKSRRARWQGALKYWRTRR